MNPRSDKKDWKILYRYDVENYVYDPVVSREYNVENLTTYKNKRYLTNRDTILLVYNNMISKGEIIGNSLENFLE